MNTTERRTQQNEENYLKTVLLLQKRKGTVTPSDMAVRLGVTTSNVYLMLTALSNKGYVLFEKGTRHKAPSVCLTQEGRIIAEPVLERHQVVQQWLLQLGVGEEEADQEACLLEHGLSEKTMHIIRRHVEMASGMFGGDIAYPEKMQMMAERLGRRPVEGKTQMEKIFEGIDRHGGYEFLVSNSEFVQSLGGKEAMAQLVAQIETLGGMEQIQQNAKLVDKHGGPKALADLNARVRSLGGIEKAEQTAQTLKAAGGERLVERAVAVLANYDSFTQAEKQTEVLARIEALGGMRRIERNADIIDRFGGPQAIAQLSKLVQHMTELVNSIEKGIS